MPARPVEPIVLTDLAILPDSTFQFAFANVSGTNFSVYSTTNLSAPYTNWLKLGSVSEIAPEYYQFADPQPTSGSVSRLYRVQSP